jgi:CheY-like chemotaxis protein
MRSAIKWWTVETMRPRGSLFARIRQRGGKRKTILLVDGNPGVREVAAELIRGARYRVLEAESAKAAMAVAGRGEISSTRRPLKSFMSRDIRRVRGWSGTTAARRSCRSHLSLPRTACLRARLSRINHQSRPKLRERAYGTFRGQPPPDGLHHASAPHAAPPSPMQKNFRNFA